MPETKTKADSVQVQMKRLNLQNTRLEARNQVIEKELKFAKEQLLQIKADYETRVATRLKLDIQGVLGISDAEVERLTQGKDIKELEAMVSNFMLARPADKKPGSFKPISIAGATESRGLTVGSTFGMTQKEINESLKGEA